jgi:hypothetical protein
MSIQIKASTPVDMRKAFGLLQLRLIHQPLQLGLMLLLVLWLRQHVDVARCVQRSIWACASATANGCEIVEVRTVWARMAGLFPAFGVITLDKLANHSC